MTKEELENYEPKGELTGFPKEIITRMLQYQEGQGNKRDISVFEINKEANNQKKGFSWLRTKEGWDFWNQVISNKDFNLFFEKYPKQDNQDNSQEFRAGDKVYDIMCKSSGIITNVSMGGIEYPLTVELENGKIINTYTINGILNSYFKTPQLFHYRDDYDYSIIDFNNLPKRQEPKKGRAEKGQRYYYIDSYFDVDMSFDVDSFIEGYSNIDTKFYNSGNYFRTEVEAEIIAQKLNSYFKQLIKEEHEHKRN